MKSYKELYGLHVIRLKLIIVLFFSSFPNTTSSQTNEIINPKGKWYFGAEIGLNVITSYTLNESNTSLQGGILLEYYFAENWSLSGRVKYFKTGLSFNQDSAGGSFFFIPGSSGRFNGAVVTIPVNLKWEFRIYKKLRGNIKLGYAYNIETTSEYLNYTDNVSPDYPRHYGSINPGLGFNYFVNKKIAIYLDVENYFGPEKGKAPSLLSNGKRYLNNLLYNIGIKYNFKN